MREALEFYADPFSWKAKHDPEDVVRIPDFYSETSFGDTAVEALAALQLPRVKSLTGSEDMDCVFNPHRYAEPSPSEANSTAAPVAASIVTCCVTGAIPGDGGACGDCDPCIQGEAFVPEAVKRLIAEKNSLISRIGELEDAAPVDAGVREALDHVLQSLNCLASGLLSPDQNELSTSMASVAAEAIPHAMIIAEALSSQPVVEVDQKSIATKQSTDATSALGTELGGEA